MHTVGMFCGRMPGGYLARSAALMRTAVSPASDANKHLVDKDIRNVLTGDGPVMVNRRTLGIGSMLVRRVGNVLYDRSFADTMLRFILQNETRLSKCMNLYQTKLQLGGNEFGLSCS